MTTAKSSRGAGKGKTAEERVAEVEALGEQLNEAVAALTNSEAWLRMLRYRRGSPTGLRRVPGRDENLEHRSAGAAQ